MLAFAVATHQDPRGYRVNWHHRLICKKLDQFAEGRIKRLILAAPPRVGKSELVSIKLPAFILGRNPMAKILATSHTADLAVNFSRKVQRLMLSLAYHRIFPRSVLPGPGDRRWKLTDKEFDLLDQGDNYRAAGIGGFGAGRGADFILVDDPIKNRKEANSPTFRKNLWEMFLDDLEPRLDGDGGILVMATRWHEDDLTGRLIDRGSAVEADDIDDDLDPEKWVVLNLPARLDDEKDRMPGDPRAIGDPLWPWLWAGRRDSMSEEEMRTRALAKLARREKKNPWGFVALFQGKPSAPAGNMFQAEQIQIVPFLKVRRVSTVRYWDKAANDKVNDMDSAQTASGRIALLEDGRFLIEDSLGENYMPAERNKLIRQTARVDGVGVRVFHEQEGGSGGKESALSTTRGLAGFIVQADLVSKQGSKVARAIPLAEQVAAGNVLMLTGDWNKPLLEQLRAFPIGKRKDRVDSLVGAFNKLTLEEDGYDLSAMVGGDDDDQ